MDMHKLTNAELNSPNAVLKTENVDNMIMFNTKWVAEIDLKGGTNGNFISSPIFSVGPNNSIKFTLKLKFDHSPKPDIGGLVLELKISIDEINPKVVLGFVWEAHCLNYKLQSLSLSKIGADICQYKWNKKSSLNDYLIENKYLVIVIRALMQVSLDKIGIPSSLNVEIPRFSHLELSTNHNITHWCYVNGLNLSMKYNLSLADSKKTRSSLSSKFDIKNNYCPNMTVQFALYTESVPALAGIMKRHIPEDMKIIFSEGINNNVIFFWSLAVVGPGGDLRHFSSSSESSSIDLCLSSNKKEKYDGWQNYIFKNETMVFVNHVLMGFPIKKLNAPEILKETPQVENEDLNCSLVNSFMDFTFLIENENIAVHRDMLCYRSPFFKECFEKNPDIMTYELNKLELEHAEKLVEYFYTGSIKDIKITNAMKLLSHAEVFKLRDLVNICEKTLKSNLNCHNVLSVIRYSKKLELDKLKEEALYFAALNLREVAEQEEYKDFVENENILIKELLFAIPQLPNIKN